MPDGRPIAALLLLIFLILSSPGCGKEQGSVPSPVPISSTVQPTVSSPDRKALLENLKLSLPRGWKAEFDVARQQWRVHNNAPPDYPTVYIRVLFPEYQPRDLREFTVTLETSTVLTDGSYVLAATTERATFLDGYYIVGKFRPRGQSIRNMGFAMIRSLGGQRLIFASYQINDMGQRQESLDFCKSARF